MIRLTSFIFKPGYVVLKNYITSILFWLGKLLSNEITSFTSLPFFLYNDFVKLFELCFLKAFYFNNL